MKKCCRCHKEKKEEYFYKDKSRKNGFYPACKECEASRRLKRIDYLKDYYKKHKKYFQKKWRYWHDTNRKQFNAVHKTGRSKRNGKITQEPCIVCGSLLTEAHHDDYSKPLDVIWLCLKHHIWLHRGLKEML